jgi:hypothetical protein
VSTAPPSNRISWAGAVDQVTSHGDRRGDIFIDDENSLTSSDVLTQAQSRFDAQALATFLIGNRYHFVLHTRAANLSSLMRHINGV